MANIYTCTAATGDIEGLTTETSGSVKINYTLSDTSAGSVEGNTTDGVYETVETYDVADLTLAGYTGVVTVNSVLPLSIKTQREEFRILTHEEGIKGDSQEVATLVYGLVDSFVDNGDGSYDIATSDASIGAYTTQSSTNNNATVNISNIVGEWKVRYLNGSWGEQDLVEGLNTIVDSGTSSLYWFSKTEESSSITISDIWIGDYVEENIYRIDHVLQDEVPLPDPDTFINLDGTAKIGYADTIDAEHGSFRVYTSVKTEAEQLAIYNEITG